MGYIIDTLKHTYNVYKNLNTVAKLLRLRGVSHDQSKLADDIEYDTFEEFHSKNKLNAEYGTVEYDNEKSQLKQGLIQHYKNNSHHPEHYSNGLDGMSLLDIMEMLADWKAATDRHENDNIYKSLEINKKRYNMSDQLYNILLNTVKELNW